MVAIIDQSLSLYAHDANNGPVCVFIKKCMSPKTSKTQDTTESTTPILSVFIVSVKCQNQNLAENLVQNICNEILLFEKISI